MDFSYSPEQELLRSTVRAFLADHYGFGARREASEQGPGWRPDIWRELGQLGVLDFSHFSLPVADGNGAPSTADPATDTTAIENAAIVQEELGRVLALEPYLEASIVSAGLLRHSAHELARRLLGQITDGEGVVVTAMAEPTSMNELDPRVTTTAHADGDGWIVSGTKSMVIAAPWASHVIVPVRHTDGLDDATMNRGEDLLSLFIIDLNDPLVTRTSYPTIDGRRAADIIIDGVTVRPDALIGEVAQAAPLLALARDHMLALLAAEAVGVMETLLHDTVEYAKQRHQFGQSIGTYQALQHRMVDMMLHLEMARSTATLAALSLEQPAADRGMATSTAKVTISEAARFIGQNAVQLFGGIGMSIEAPVSHYFKRTTTIDNGFGSVDYHLTRYAELRAAGPTA